MEEKINAKKFAADAALQMFMSMMLVYVFSWFGAEDPDKYDKMKERSGALNEDDFELCYDTPVTDDVMGHRDEQDIEIIMEEVQSL